MLGIITYVGITMLAWVAVTSVKLSVFGRYLPIAISIFENEGIFKYWGWYIGQMLKIAVPFWIAWTVVTFFTVMIGMKNIE